MADLRLRINELPEELNPASIDNIAIDGPTTRRTTLQAAADAVRPYSTEVMAREGLNNASVMTPLRVSQAVETLGGQRFATVQQGNKADTAVQPTRNIIAGSGLAGGGVLAADVTLALSSTSLASLALANSAVQPARQISAGTGLSGGGSLAADRTLSLSSATISSLARADTAVQPARSVNAGTGLTGGGDLSADRTVALNAASIASLARADSAVQPARAIVAGTGMAGGGDLSTDRTVSLSAASQASLAKADSAIQAPGGAAGQVLTKNSNADNDVGWQSIDAATAVSYAPQTLTAPQQTQARANISAQQAGAILEALRLASGPAADQLPYMTSATAAAFTALTPFARTLLDDTTAAAARATLGAFASTGGDISGQTNFTGGIVQIGANTGSRVLLRYDGSISYDAGATWSQLHSTSNSPSTGDNTARYARFPNGFIIQYGYGANPGNDHTRGLPLTFPNLLIAALVTPNAESINAGAALAFATERQNNSGFIVRPRYINNGGTVGVATQGYWWVAIGY